MLLFTVTEINNQNSPVIQDIIYRDDNVLKDTKKLPPEDQEPTLNKKYGDKKLRVDKKYLVSLGLPTNPDDITIEVIIINSFRLIHWQKNRILINDVKVQTMNYRFFRTITSKKIYPIMGLLTPKIL